MAGNQFPCFHSVGHTIVFRSPDCSKHREIVKMSCRSSIRISFSVVTILVLLIARDTHSSGFADELLPHGSMDAYHYRLINYVETLLCVNGTYRFFHIYIDRWLETPMADKLIDKLNACMVAGIMTSR